MTFIFYDTETTGLNAAFDQVLQFAAIVTDDDFKPLDEINLRCRPKSHVIPSPGAMRVTRVGPRAIAAAPLSCYEMTCQIRAFIERWSPAVLVGFNSISFDENMLRHAFFQSLHPTYLTNTNGNCRMDVLRLAHAVAAHQPDVLIVPQNEKGKPSFKLAHLVPANRLQLDNAHDALADTRATVALASFIRQRAPQVWQDQFLCRSRHAVEELVVHNPLVLFTDRAFKKSTILAGAICSNPGNPSAIAMFDLEYDAVTYLDATVEDLCKLLKASPRPIRVMRANASPIVAPYRGDRDMGVDAAEAQRRLDLLRSHQPFVTALGQAMAAAGDEYDEPEHIEQTIFAGFPIPRDKMAMEAFHKAPWPERYQLLDRFHDPRYREFGERLIYEEYPDGLPAERRAALAAWARQRHAPGEDTPWLTVAKALEELEEIKTEAGPEETALVAEIEEYLAELQARLTA
jgi:exodeoxyribonuclease-1